ncbi:MAG TPA: cobalamin-binding protein [Verrucomicrobiae bacterium]|nr:cobalamin-binding protein [Verrucomicrobiae bacterium]
MKRIVSLLPSATEIVCALGAGNRLVGRSHECDYPPEVLSMPVCTAAKVDATASSSEIDRQVKQLVQDAVSVYRIDTDSLRRLKPDLILTQAQCEVCAVSLPEVEAAVGQSLGTKPRIISLSPKRLADIWDDFRTVAEALDLADHGKEVLRSLKMRVVGVIERACMLKNPPSVACVEWIEPLMAAGNWVPEMVELAGGRNLVGEAARHSAWMNWDTLREHNPDIIIFMPCGFGLQRTRAEMGPMLQRPEWAKLHAVRNGRVCLTDGNQFFNRPGPRIVESLEILAEICHPDRFNFGHRGKGWEKL